MTAVPWSKATDDTIAITPDGYERLQEELGRLRLYGRGQIRDLSAEARSDGDVDDNTALIDVLDNQALLERRIAELQMGLAAARVVEPADPRVAQLGTKVRLRETRSGEETEYLLVGSIEADVTQGRLSVDAPVGRALLGATQGDEIEVQTPSGTVRLAVVSVWTPSMGRLPSSMRRPNECIT
jgi:transcription elongation factor GreA